MKEKKIIEVTDPTTGEKIEFPKKDVKIIPPVHVENTQTMKTAMERGESVIPLTSAKHRQDVQIIPKKVQ